MGEPLTFVVLSALIAVVAVPLVLGLVPPNRVYGVRTTRTLADPALWYRANRFGGVALVLAAAASEIGYLAFPALASGRSFGGLLLFLGPLVVALVAILAYLGRAS